MAAWINHNCANSRATHWKKDLQDYRSSLRIKSKSHLWLTYVSHTQIHKGVFMSVLLVKSVLCIVSNTEEGMLVFTTNKCWSPQRHHCRSLPALNKQGESWNHTGFTEPRGLEVDINSQDSFQTKAPSEHTFLASSDSSSVMQPCAYQLVICIKYSFLSIYKHPRASHRSLCIDCTQKTTFTQQLTSCLIHPKWTSLDIRDVLGMTARRKFNCPY